MKLILAVLILNIILLSGQIYKALFEQFIT